MALQSDLTTIHIVVPERMKAAVYRRAKAKGVSVPGLVREAIDGWLALDKSTRAAKPARRAARKKAAAE